MKLLAPALIFCGAAFGQSPQVPHKMQFAGMTLTIRDDVRRDIQKDVDALTQHPKYFNIKVERARTYFPAIEKIFAEERLPDDFKFLALQESALVPDAVSSSNAVGFWQFKDFTAREMGLRVDDEVDERMNIVIASRAAARYIKQCNHYFNNWLYALQSYQMGAGGVMRAVGDRDLGTRHMEITPDTYWYVRKFLAHKVAFEEAIHGSPAILVTNLYVTGKTLVEVSTENSIDPQRVRDFNKWLKAERIPSDHEYPVALPMGEGVAGFGVLASAALTTTPVAVVKTEVKQEAMINELRTIRAQSGENLQALTDRGKIDISDFLHYNEMRIDQPVQAGQVYFLEKKRKKALIELYTVQPGEDLWLVSQRFGIQQKFIRKYNGLSESASVAPGATLYLENKKPAGGATTEPSAVAVLDEDDSFGWDTPMAQVEKKNPVLPDAKLVAPSDSVGPEQTNDAGIHEVKESDTLYSVARQYGVTIQELMNWNEKKDFSLAVGEKLKIRSR